MHTWTLHPSLHDHVLATLDYTRAARPTRSVILGRLHPALALVERGDRCAQILRLGVLVALALTLWKDG